MTPLRHPAARLGMAALAPLFVTLLATPVSAQDEAFKPGQKQPAPPSSAPDKTTPAKEKLKDDSRGVFDTGPAKPSGATSNSSWSIIIVAMRGDNQDIDGPRALLKVQNEGGLKAAYLEKRGQASVIAYGHYDDPSVKQAQADLDRVKNIEVVVNGQKQKPFTLAYIAPPESVQGTIPEFDLRNARRVNGDWALYTLQIGVYSREDGKPPSAADMAEFRKAAEQAVLKLRHEGEQAFYFHGPHRSMVTVGLFGKDDFDPQTPGVESATLKLAREHYPYNLNNGMGTRHTYRIIDPKSGAQAKKQKIEPSGLVNVPKE